MNCHGALVLGYPRTGTSATTAALASLGLSPGTLETLKEPADANERGFWEQRPLSHLNARILEHLGGGRWSAPPDLLPGWIESDSLTADKSDARKLFGKTFTSSPWVDLPVLVTRYGDLIDDPERWAETASAFLDGCGLRTTLQGANLHELVDRRLRHSAVDAHAVSDSVISHPQVHLYETLDSLTGAHERFRTPSLPPETEHTEWLIAESRRADIATRRLRERFAARLEGQRRTAQRLNPKVDAHVKKIERMRLRETRRASREGPSAEPVDRASAPPQTDEWTGTA